MQPVLSRWKCHAPCLKRALVLKINLIECAKLTGRSAAAPGKYNSRVF